MIMDEGQKPRPLVLVVDDEPAEASFADAVRAYGVGAVYAHPEEVTSNVLQDAALVIVDQYLDNWPQRAQRALPPSLAVLDGLSLAGVLRAHTDRSAERAGRPDRPVAFALRTGELAALAANLPAGSREYLLASQYNLEGVFDKAAGPDGDVPGVARRAALLARAAAALPHDWGPGTDDPGQRWLGLSNTAWTAAAAWQVEHCRPPQHSLAERTTGAAWLRWFLHRILPYPTFLLDRTQAATTLGLTRDALDEVVDGDEKTALTQALDSARYDGQLAGFAGDRWWRAGLYDAVRGLASSAPSVRPQGRKRLEGRSAVALPALAGGEDAVASGGDLEWDPDDEPLSVGDVAVLAERAHGRSLARIAAEDPVLILGADMVERREPVSATDAVRIQPDAWPPYADDAWADRGDLDDEDTGPALRALVVSEDRWRVPNDGPAVGHVD